MKASGKCTTDQISPAGKWLQYRGHLDNISDNMFSGAENSYVDTAGTGCNVFTGACGDSLSAIARDYKNRGQGWVAVGDKNYGEGSSREHAAMSPRFLGCRVVLVRSFARIHETNLKKQGMLGLTFQNKDDYDLVQEGDLVDVLGLKELAPGKPLEIVLHHSDGSNDRFLANHTLNNNQIHWFRAGSALNLIRQENQ